MARRELENTVKLLKNRGIQFQTVPSIEIENTLSYSELSDMLDVVVSDVYKRNPDIFNTSSTAYFTTPGRLKAYLYLISLFHFFRAGILSNTGGLQLPNCAGSYVPTPLLAYLQNIGVYDEGGWIGRAKYICPSTLPVVGNSQIVTGSPAETALNLSGIPSLTMSGYVIDNTRGEYVLATATADTNNVIVNWNSYSDIISDLLAQSGYPCIKMWLDVPRVTEGSYFACPSRGVQEASTGAAMIYLACPFKKWDVEIASLYFTTATVATSQAIPPQAWRMGPATYEWPTYLESTWLDPYYARKCMFVKIVSCASYAPGIYMKKLRNYHGKPLKSWVCIPRRVDCSGYHYVVSRSILQLFEQSGTYDMTTAFAINLIHNHVLIRKLLQLTIGNAASTSWERLLPSVQIDEFELLVPAAQILNELGDFVKGGMLHVPVPGALWDNPTAWYVSWTSASSQTDSGPNAQWLVKADSALTWKVPTGGANSLDIAWAAAYGALVGRLGVSWIAINRAYQIMMKACATGLGNYGRGNLTYPPSKSTWGGASVMCEFVHSSAVQTMENSWTLNTLLIDSFYSNTLIVKDNIPIAVVSAWGAPYSSSWTNSRFAKRMGEALSDNHVEYYVAQIMSPGGTVLDMLSKAMELRHMRDNGDKFGMVSANEDLDACLWDALKGVVSTMAGVIAPVLPDVAAFGCSQIPIVGKIMSSSCEDATRALIGYVSELGDQASNREDGVTKGKLDQIQVLAKKTPLVAMGQLPENRPSPRVIIRENAKEVRRQGGAGAKPKVKKNGKVKPKIKRNGKAVFPGQQKRPNQQSSQQYKKVQTRAEKIKTLADMLMQG